MLNRPIGVIDSGVGGLTVLKELKQQLPMEEFIYVGDTARCPYGSKQEEAVIKYAWEMVQYLLQFEIKMLVVACNTVTAIALEAFKNELPIPVVGVIEPGARAAVKETKTNKVAIIGTHITIESNAYGKMLKNMNRHIDPVEIACPNFVPLIEKGKTNDYEIKLTIDESLNVIKQDVSIDTLILGCTHYPIIQPAIESYFGEKVTILSSAEETALEVNSILTSNNLISQHRQSNRINIMLTGELNLFYKLQADYFQFTDFQLERIKL